MYVVVSVRGLDVSSPFFTKGLWISLWLGTQHKLSLRFQIADYYTNDNSYGNTKASREIISIVIGVGETIDHNY